LPPNSTHLTQPLDVAVFAPLKKVWRAVLDKYKAECIRQQLTDITIPKDRFGYLLTEVMGKTNANNIISGFAACGIIPLNVDRILARLPPERTAEEAEGVFSQQLADELRLQRYGDPQKQRRAKKADRLPPGTSFTIRQSNEAEEVASAGKFIPVVR